ncbi:uncharacterized protein LOC126879091 [Diabrotica virgifera virgifera]|uniref:Uncharacterized protein n=1 Tax=Diabrotica virgifera virgifera TaxID=50390 RepID=A0ABM5JJ58_DIAVI|nr:uncharacterized protein LOC126879091 [Diabrotica virgifera virgifera]XP_050497976.1 uncharacterized protein LOC126879091 [Diabrotica virgifera virgifera]XP_050497977.1 uncharacterized protein LOC126879091 [Diabrotica virgifera virgifera]
MDDLLQYVLELSRESALLPSVKGKSQNNSHQQALVIRENATLNLFNDSSTIDVHEEIIVESEDPTKPGSSQQKIEETPGKKRTILTPKGNRRNVGLKQSSLDYLQKKNDRWFEIRSRELALQEREKTLQEEKFKLAKWETEKRTEMEEKRLEVQLDLFKNQQKLVEAILNKSSLNL